VLAEVAVRLGAEDPPLYVVQVDCSNDDNHNRCKEHEVKHYPTLKILRQKPKASLESRGAGGTHADWQAGDESEYLKQRGKDFLVGRMLEENAKWLPEEASTGAPMITAVYGCANRRPITRHCYKGGGTLITVYGQGFGEPKTVTPSITIGEAPCEVQWHKSSKAVVCVLGPGEGQDLDVVMTITPGAPVDAAPCGGEDSSDEGKVCMPSAVPTFSASASPPADEAPADEAPADEALVLTMEAALSYRTFFNPDFSLDQLHEEVGGLKKEVGSLHVFHQSSSIFFTRMLHVFTKQLHVFFIQCIDTAAAIRPELHILLLLHIVPKNR
jgi:hypothetical protein